MSDTEEELSDLPVEEDFEEDFEDEMLTDDPSSSSTSEPPRKRSKTVRGTVKPPLVKCHICKRPFRTLDGYRTHLMKHVVEDLLKNSPGLAGLREECRSVYLDVLEGFQVLKPEGGMTADISNIAAKLKSVPNETATIFVDRLSKELWECLPAPSITDIQQFHGTYLKQIHHMFLTNVEKRGEFRELLKVDLQLEFSDKAIEWFLTDFCRKLGMKMEVFYVRYLKEPYQVLCRSEDNRDYLDSLNFQQTVHYIGGSAVKSVLRKAQKGLGTKAWSDIYDCMNKKFLVGEGLPSPGEDIEAWTDAVDRGGLKHINDKVWSFLIALSGVLKKEEGKDGSILHKKVLDVVRG